ncbi:Patatin [Chlamydiales bacterium STE3]|nr:Patatin [Chlamydiales bacterium STE3]
MISEVQPSSSSILSWRLGDLETECKKINYNRDGSRQVRFTKILQRFQEDIKNITEKTELIELRKRFWVIEANVAVDIKKRPDFIAYLTDTEKEIDDCFEIVQRLEEIQKKLLSSTGERDLASLNTSTKKIERQISSNLLPIYKKIIEECERCYKEKLFFNHLGHCSEGQDSIPIHEKPQSYAKCEDNKSIYPILSLDGGGARGIIPASVLVKIEKITQEPIAKLFKLIGGTSTGGILALGLTKPHNDDPKRPQYTAEDLLDMYTQEHSEIFRKNSDWAPLPADLELNKKISWLLDHPKYKDPSKFFTRKLGANTRLSSALTDVVVIANTSDEILRKFRSIGVSELSAVASVTSAIFGGPLYTIPSHDDIPKTVQLYTRKGLKTFSYRLQDLKAGYLVQLPHQISFVNRGDFPMHHVATVTSAAPTYFPLVEAKYKVTERTQTTNFLMDGGVLQNNPTLPCVFEALDSGHKKEDLFLLSLGTGGNDSMLPRNYSGWLDVWSDITQPHFETQNIMSSMIEDRYYRFQYEFENPAPPLDDVRPETIEFLKDCGKQLVEENEDSIRAICKVLKPDSI